MQLYQHQFKAMGCPCNVQLYAPNHAKAQQVIDALLTEVQRLEQKYSRYLSNSLLSQINQSAGQAQGIVVDEETAALLDYAANCYQQSDGLFDISAGILNQVWTFKQAALPKQTDIDRLLKLVGWHKIQWHKPHLVLPLKGMALDFGGIVKEYAVDSAASVCLNHGIHHALIDLGGDIRAVGCQADGSAWQVGIRHPRKLEKLLNHINLKKGAIASSGDYERYIQVDGKRYCHILNPKTGWPIQNHLKSVSVIADYCVVAGSVSSIAMLKQQHGKHWLAQSGLDYVCY